MEGDKMKESHMSERRGKSLDEWIATAKRSTICAAVLTVAMLIYAPEGGALLTVTMLLMLWLFVSLLAYILGTLTRAAKRE